MRDIPWAGLLALVLMFLLPARLFEPRTVKHRPIRHVCAECGAPWAAGHTCEPGAVASGDADRPLKAELVRLDQPRELKRRVARGLRRRRRP
jgi:hypothetical protein